MSKKEATQTPETQQPSVYDDLLKNGTAVLKATTRDELAEMVDNIPVDTKYMVGAVGRNQDGDYTLQVDIIK